MEAREVITRGISVWNQWREERPSYAWGEYDLTHIGAPARYRLPISRPDLSGIDLSGKDLSGANFEGCILSDANLSHAKLIGANLNGADLSRANMCRACLLKSHGSK